MSKTRLALWSVLFCAIRILYLCTSWKSYSPQEELIRGGIAREWLRLWSANPPTLPFWYFQADHYLGGSLVTGIITAINFKIFGESFFSLKLSALYFALAALLFTYYFLVTNINERAADLFALLYCFAPPSFVGLGLVSMGYHTESVLFFSLFLLLSFSWRKNPSSSIRPFFLGLLGGFSFWYSYINGITFFSACIFFPWMSFSWKERTKALAALGSGSLLGLTPWILYNVQCHYEGITLLISYFGIGDKIPGHAFSILKSLRKIAVFYIRDLAFAASMPSKLLSGIFFSLQLALISLSIYKKKFFKEIYFFSMIYIIIFSLFYSISIFYNDTISAFDFTNYRYLLQAKYLLLIVVAVACASLPRKSTISGIGSLVALSVFGFSLLNFSYPLMRVFHYKPYGEFEFGSTILDNWLAPPEKTPLFFQFLQNRPSTSPDTTIALTDEIPPFEASNEEFPNFKFIKREYYEQFPWIAEGLGTAASFHKHDGEAIRRSFNQLPESALPFFIHGYLGQTLGKDDELAKYVPPKYLATEKNEADFIHALLVEISSKCEASLKGKAPATTWARRGLGAAMAQCTFFDRSIVLKDRYEKKVYSDTELADLSWGMGWYIRKEIISDPLRALDEIMTLPKWARKDAVLGAKYVEETYHLGAKNSVDAARSAYWAE